MEGLEGITRKWQWPMESYGGALVLLTTPSANPWGPKPLISFLKLKQPKLFYCHYVIIRRSYSNITTTTGTRCDSNRWDSNAEIPGFNFKFKFQNGNDYSVKIEEEDDDDDEEKGSARKGKKKKKKRKKSWWSDQEDEPPGMLEEAIDNLWVLQLAKSYGWIFPPIVIASLLATGPKAFLMVLALSVGHSVLTFAFEKLLGRKPSKPKRKAWKRRKPFAGTIPDAEIGDEDEKLETVKGRMGYRSWVVNGICSVNKDIQGAPNLGGWDELETTEAMQRPPHMKGRFGRKPSGNGKLGMTGTKDGPPLLLRLLIAVFPFLGSWSKML